MKENKETSNYQLTTVRGRHHGPVMVLVGTEFSSFLIFHGRGITWASIGPQDTLK